MWDSPENIDTKMSNYYLNNTSTSYDDIIERAKDILYNYYKTGKESINEGIQLMLNKFENSVDDGNKINDIYEYKKFFNVGGK